VTANEDSYRIGGESQQSKCLSAMARRGEMSWPTPIQGDSHLASTPEAAARRLAEGKSTLSRLVESGQAAPASSSSDGSRRGLWATPRSGKTTDEDPATWAKRQAQGNVATMPLTAQVKCWGTPTARDHKSGRGNEDREYKELTPMVERTQSGKLNPRWVETLMGLPIGWVMPSCSCPVITGPTN